MKSQLNTMISLTAGIVTGYALSHHVSHPSGRARKHVPLVRLANVQITPNLLLATKNRHWHIHHWAYLPAAYLPIIVLLRSIRRLHLIHGLILGAILHGLTFRDRFKFAIEK